MNGEHKLIELFDNQMLSVEDLSKFLKLSTSTIRDWVLKRKIPFVKIGKHIRFRYEPDIRNWLDERRQGCQ